MGREVMAGLAEIIAVGKEFGIFEFYLPFILMFTLVYAILDKSKIFGEKAKRINAIVAIVSSAFVMAYTPVGITLTQFFGAFFTGTLGIFITMLGIVMIAYILSALFAKEGEGMKRLATPAIIIAGILGVATFISSGGLAIFPGIVLPEAVIPEVPIVIPSIGLTYQDLAIIFLVLTFIAIVLWLTKEEKEKKKEKKGIFIPLPKE
jgi:hypothetical protein